jgi:hypothetical protein
MVTDRLHMAFVEAHKLDVWIRDCEQKGGVVKFVVPHAYTLTMDHLSRTQEFRMTVETERVVYTLPEAVGDGQEKEG